MSDKQLSQTAIALVLNELNAAEMNSNINANGKVDTFTSAVGFRINHDLIRQFKFKFNGKGR